ncbi:MAG TPA: hypothetical protein VGD37_31105 [Kofleriaceae bacterium]
MADQAPIVIGHLIAAQVLIDPGLGLRIAAQPVEQDAHEIRIGACEPGMTEQLVDELVDLVIERAPRVAGQLCESRDSLGEARALELHEPVRELLQGRPATGPSGVRMLQRVDQLMQKVPGVVVHARVHLGVGNEAAAVLLHVAPEAAHQVSLAVTRSADDEQRPAARNVP